ncbi:LysM peptidoglycan-binding domain-containing protein [Macrococcus sp. DPC7161]|uniref:LysM peptidoglycan-binding domain-containing protein n=1 Tax=Macrococcus sp. DPC7161 TaxID=2507060 RepID=UPI00100A3523|nr:LysM peptidoglycan-binding domain-containing protein [Macrococcus sp. DPC7161]RXK19293.1 LysM domain-containing protein [Macrococcus sp. DPC7161]
MSNDNFKDEFEKSKQPVEPKHKEPVVEDTQVVGKEETVNETVPNKKEEQELFPPRGVSRRNRMERKQRERQQETVKQETQNEVKNKEQSEEVNQEQKPSKSKRNQSIFASATGVGGAVVGNVTQKEKNVEAAEPSKTQTNDNVKKEETHRENNNQKNKQQTQNKQQNNKNNKKKAAVAAGAVGAAGVAGAAANGKANAAKVNASKETNNINSNENYELPKENKGQNKKLLPIIGAILLLIPIFALLMLFINHQNAKNDDTTVVQKVQKSDKANSDKASKDAKDKAANKDANKDDNKATDSTADKNKENKDKTATEDKTKDKDANQAAENSTTEQPNQATQQNTNNQNQQQNGATSHVVSGSENLYRIAIRYYGSGTPENVEKIRRANGISGNNLTQGQTLVIPQ